MVYCSRWQYDFVTTFTRPLLSGFVWSDPLNSRHHDVGSATIHCTATQTSRVQSRVGVEFYLKESFTSDSPAQSTVTSRPGFCLVEGKMTRERIGHHPQMQRPRSWMLLRLTVPMGTELWDCVYLHIKKTFHSNVSAHYQGLEASAWSVCSLSPPSTSIVQ